MTINLPENLERSIEAAVQDGHFASVDDAMAEAARLLLEKCKGPKLAGAQAEDEVLRQMLADGLIARLPNPDAGLDDEDDGPVVIDGEPLSETIIRERR